MATTQLFFDVDTDRYYAGDLCPLPCLNQTTARLLVAESPKHAWAQHPKLGARKREASEDMELGSIIDEMVLGGSKRIEVLRYDDFRTTAAKLARDAAKEAGKIPVKVGKMEELEKLRDATLKNLGYAGVALDGHSQVCLLWPEYATNGNSVQCCALLDHVYLLDEHAGLIRDLKTAKSAHPSKLGFKAHDFGYHIQAVAYKRGLERNVPALLGRTRFENVYVETAWPHVVVLAEPDGEALQVGEALWQRAIDKWEECLRTDKWPGYTKPGEVVRYSLPNKAIEALYAEEVASGA